MLIHIAPKNVIRSLLNANHTVFQTTQTSCILPAHNRVPPKLHAIGCSCAIPKVLRVKLQKF